MNLISLVCISIIIVCFLCIVIRLENLSRDNKYLRNELEVLKTTVYGKKEKINISP